MEKKLPVDCLFVRGDLLAFRDLHDDTDDGEDSNGGVPGGDGDDTSLIS